MRVRGRIADDELSHNQSDMGAARECKRKKVADWFEMEPFTSTIVCLTVVESNFDISPFCSMLHRSQHNFYCASLEKDENRFIACLYNCGWENSFCIFLMHDKYSLNWFMIILYDHLLPSLLN